MLPCLEESPRGVVLQLRIQPRSSKSRIVGLHDGVLKIKLTSPPVDGEANKSLCAFLAKLFGVAKSQVVIVAGATARRKRVLIENMPMEKAAAIISPLT